MNWIKAHKVWSAVIAVAVLAVIGAAAGGGSSSDGTPAAQQTTVSTPTPTLATAPTPTPTPVALGPVQRVRAALGDSVSSDLAVGDSTVKGVARSGNLLTVTLATPSGGFQGPSTNDADHLAAVAYAKTYLTGWKGGAVVRFVGGLADARTGQDKPNAIAFSYYMGAKIAQRIDWSNQDALDTIRWSIYREVCVPAFKGC